MLRLQLAGAGVILALIASLWLYARLEHGRAERAQAAAATATRQATYERSAGKIEAQRSINTKSIIRHTEEGKRLVAQAPDLQSSVDEFRAAAERVLLDANEPTDPDEKRHDPGG